MTRSAEGESATTVPERALPEFAPWREVGWIFRDGGCVAIERRGDETRSRTIGD